MNGKLLSLVSGAAVTSTFLSFAAFAFTPSVSDPTPDTTPPETTTPNDDGSSTSSSSTGTLSAGRYIITNEYSGKALSVDGGSTADGANVIQQDYNGSGAQQWDVDRMSNGTYTIRAANSSKSLDVWEWSEDDGADVRLWSFLGAENQQWRISDTNGGKYSIVSELSGKAIEVFDFSTSNGGNIGLWTFWSGEPQLWTFKPIGDSGSTANPGGNEGNGSASTVPFNISGQDAIHDPSTIVRDGDRYWTFGTGQGAGRPINALYSYDLMRWHQADSPITPHTYPSWINRELPVFDGNFWAPDIIEMNGRYYLYYSAFSSSVLNSAIGVMVTDSLNNPNWRDLGKVVSTKSEPRSSQGEPVNAIDAGLYRDADDNVWMTYGSHYAGIFIRQINPSTGMLLDNRRHNAAGNRGGWNEYEAAQVQYINGYYYMFVNLGACCEQLDSDYIIYAGRSNSPTGPFITQSGHNLWHGDVISQRQVDAGVTTGSVLSSQRGRVGPGHFGYLNYKGQDLASIHYYGGSDGWGHLAIMEMTFVNGWPRFNYNFDLRQ